MTVHNFGPLIPLDERERLFDAFHRTPEASAGREKGWGLGLSAVRLIAEAHGGVVVVDSSAQEGTTFTLDILVDASRFTRGRNTSQVQLASDDPAPPPPRHST